MLRHLTVLLLLSAIAFGAGLGLPAITESDEAYYAEAAREMVERGDWVTPHFNYEFRFQKPILYYWLAAGGYLVAGVSEAAARFPSALAGMALALIAYFAGRRVHDADAGLLAGSIVATNYGYVAIGRQALPDLLLTAFIVLATWCLMEWWDSWRRAASGERNAAERRWLLAGSASMAAGFLAKGPVGFVLPVIVLVPVIVVEVRRHGLTLQSLIRALRTSDLLLAALVFLALVAPWYAAMVREHGAWYLQQFFVGENLERFATDRYNDPRPVWFYVPVLVGGLLPWSPFLLLLVPPLIGVLKRKRPISDIELRLGIWAAAPLLFYTASVGKQPRYILPVMPPLAILLGRAISARMSPRATSADRRLLNICALLTGALLLVVPLGLFRMNTLLQASGSFGATPLIAATLIIAGLLPLIAVAAPAPRWMGCLVTAAAAMTLVTLQYAVFCQARPTPVERMAEAVRAERTAKEPIATYNVFERNLIFYSRVRQAGIFSDAALVDFLHSPRRVLCVLNSDDLDRLTREHQLDLRQLFIVRDFDPAQIRLSTVLSPDSSRAIQTAVLVSNR